MTEEPTSFELGYLIGFFNADGYISINQEGEYQVGFCQKTKEPLEKIENILDRIGIETTISEQTETINLYINQKEVGDFLEIVSEDNLYGQKATDIKHLKKIVTLHDSSTEYRWRKQNKQQLNDIIRTWQNDRAEYTAL